MSNPDMSQYMGVFLDEAREQLELLETNILQMERGDTSAEILQTLFRAAHTVKGSSRAMGFMAVGDLTHHMEDVLDDLRNDRQVVTTEAVNVLLSCLDTLTALIDEVATSGTTTAERDAEVAALVARLDTLCNGSVPPGDTPKNGATAGPPSSGFEESASDGFDNEASAIKITPFERTAIDDAIATGLNTHHVRVTLSTECLMKSVRAYMVLGALGELGTVLVSVPNDEQLDAEDFDHTIELLFVGACGAHEIETALGRIAELEQISVRPWTDSKAVAPVMAPEAPAPSVAESPPTGAPPAPAATSNSAGHGQTIRVDVARLDNLLNLIGEMVIDRTQITQLATDMRARYRQDAMIEQLVEATDRLARITSELQDQIMKARMLPVDGVFQRMPRMVRDLAQKTDKEVQLTIEGGETELDRSVLEVIGDPLIHLLRNSVDHGIEPPAERIAVGKPSVGHIRLAARHEENHIVIEITDDGKGINGSAIKEAAVAKGNISRSEADAMSEADALMLIFASGISTARNLSDISGRGVGMDIVRSNLEKIGGRVTLETKIGVGTTFTIRLPLTLAIVRGLTVRAGGGTYVFPLSCVDEMLRMGASEDGIRHHSVGGQAAIVLRDRTVPVIRLAEALTGDKRAAAAEEIAPNAYVVVLGIGAKKIGVAVDGLCGEQEVVIKSLGKFLGEVPGVAGATILGDGSVALIVDVAKLSTSINDMSGAPA